MVKLLSICVFLWKSKLKTYITLAHSHSGCFCLLTLIILTWFTVFFVHPTSQSIPVHINYVCVLVPIYVCMYIYLHFSHPLLQLRLELKLTFKISNVEILFFFPTISLFSIETN